MCSNILLTALEPEIKVNSRMNLLTTISIYFVIYEGDE